MSAAELDFSAEEFLDGANAAEFLNEEEHDHAAEFADIPVERHSSMASDNVELDFSLGEFYAANVEAGDIRELYPHPSPPPRTPEPLVRPENSLLLSLEMFELKVEIVLKFCFCCCA